MLDVATPPLNLWVFAEVPHLTDKAGLDALEGGVDAQRRLERRGVGGEPQFDLLVGVEVEGGLDHAVAQAGHGALHVVPPLEQHPVLRPTVVPARLHVPLEEPRRDGLEVQGLNAVPVGDHERPEGVAVAEADGHHGAEAVLHHQGVVGGAPDLDL